MVRRILVGKAISKDHRAICRSIPETIRRKVATRLLKATLSRRKGAIRHHRAATRRSRADILSKIQIAQQDFCKRNLIAAVSAIALRVLFQCFVEIFRREIRP